MTKTGVLLVAVLLSACAADTEGAEDPLGPIPPSLTSALGEWNIEVSACDRLLNLNIRLSQNRGMPFVLALSGQVDAAGLVLNEDGARVYVQDGDGVAWYLELDDDGNDEWSANGAIDVPDGGCEYVGDVTVTERVRRSPAL